MEPLQYEFVIEKKDIGVKPILGNINGLDVKIESVEDETTIKLKLTLLHPFEAELQ